MGIAQRQIRIKFSQKQGQTNKHNHLPINIKTIGDWIKIEREAKNLTSGHVAAKMGIAQTLVRSWEDGETEPDSLQRAVLKKIFDGF